MKLKISFSQNKFAIKSTNFDKLQFVTVQTHRFILQNYVSLFILLFYSGDIQKEKQLVLKDL